MLYNIQISTKPAHSNWELAETNYGETRVLSLVNDTTHANIKLGNNVNAKISHTMSEDIKAVSTDEVYAALDIYSIPERTFLSNNNKTMNLVLMNFWDKDKKVVKSYVDDEILVLDYDTTMYKLINIELNVGDIVNTYRRRTLNGCVIKFKPYDYERSTLKELFTLYLFNTVEKKYEKFIATFDENELGLRKIMCSKNDVKYIHEHYAKSIKTKYMSFKCTTYDTGLITKSYIIANGDDETNAFVSTITDASVLSVDVENGKLTKESEEAIVKYTTESGIRAVTCVNDVKLSSELCRNARILYVFAYNTEKNILHCVKSN